MVETNINDFGQLIKDRRVELGLSARHLASKVGVSPAYLSILEGGRNPTTQRPSRPSYQVVFDLAGQLGLDLSRLLTLAGYERLPKVRLLKRKPLDLPKTSIIATIGGPDVYSKKYLADLVKEGMTIARINLAHMKDPLNPRSESYNYIRRVLDDITQVSEECRQPIGVLFDICGPRIRVGDLENPIPIKLDDVVTFTTQSGYGSSEKCSVTYHGFVHDIKKGDRIFLDDGKIQLEAITKDIVGNELVCRVISTSESYIKGGKGFNLPDTRVNEATLTKTDMEVLRQLADLGFADSIDFLGLSFVRDPADKRTLENFATAYLCYYDEITGEQRIPILIAKIETHEAVRQGEDGEYVVLDEIVTSFGGVMVARGDLAVETSPEDVPLIQQYLTQKVIDQGKPVIIATQMLATMTEKGHTRPTRAEANDVANAVFNYADAIMLSEETATGNNPYLCIKTMRDIALRTERLQGKERRFLKYLNVLTRDTGASGKTGNIEKGVTGRQQAIAESAILFAHNLGSPAIVVSTASGDTALKLSQYRPAQPIIAITDVERSARKMLLYHGIYPFLVEKKPSSFEEIVASAKEILSEITIGGRKLIEPKNGEKVFVPLTLGIEPGIEFSVATPGNTNTIYILELE